ncbi:MAG: beta-galactosidase [Chloroflexi bacterium]|nr:beta-galactosidase [Chloroflexota bacterium]
MAQRTGGCPPLDSFWGGGFDSISPLARISPGRDQPPQTRRADLVAATEHDRRAEHDYALLARMGIRWSREDVRWYLCEPEPGRYDFGHLEPLIAAAHGYGIRILWSWMHYGCPTFVNPLDERFPDQLAELGAHHLAWLRRHGVDDLLIAPINEISYFTWVVETLGNWYPFATGECRRLKANLAAAHRRCYDRIKWEAPGAPKRACIASLTPEWQAASIPRKPASSRPCVRDSCVPTSFAHGRVLGIAVEVRGLPRVGDHVVQLADVGAGVRHLGEQLTLVVDE